MLVLDKPKAKPTNRWTSYRGHRISNINGTIIVRIGGTLDMIGTATDMRAAKMMVDERIEQLIRQAA